jgi:hypothetical protein
MTDNASANTCADAARKKANNRNSNSKGKERIVDKLIKIAINQSEGDHPRGRIISCAKLYRLC